MANPDVERHVVVYRDTAALIPYARNARTHSDAQVAQIAGSIREFGFTNPVLIDPDGGIIAGHGRVLAALLLGLPQVPCIALAHLTPTQKRAYVIADNKLTLNGGWNDAMLAIELQSLTDDAFDVALTGFDADELRTMAAPDANDTGHGTFVSGTRFLVLVDLPDEPAQASFYSEMLARGLECKLMS